ncbi:MAG: ABC transporter ATP-binding protein [Rectinemataceae bacterium]|nr:ABC transporter ATP-binding protein [Rectinemataceae bacterium]
MPGPPALSCPRLDLREGETVFLTGPNGSGKTTFLKALNALVEPSAGAIGYRDGSEALRRDTVYLHQHPYIFSGTVGYNAGFACRAAGIPAAGIRQRSEAALELVGLSEYSARRHRQLSGGEAQRVALARVIASGAKVFLLDEPTASADAESARLISGALLSLVRQGKTLVISTHDPGFLLDFATVRRCRNLGFSRGVLISDILPGQDAARSAPLAPEFPDAPQVHGSGAIPEVS